MREEIQINKNYPNTPQTSMDQQRMSARVGNSKLPWAVLGVVVILISGIGFVFRDRLFMSKDSAQVKGVISSKASGYQSVFLTNGQVYFGKISNADSSYVTLKDIYYLQVSQQQQASQSQSQQQQQQVSLVKLGNELHGPVDEMKINRDQILFYEDMKEDAKVVQAIIEYQKNPNGTKQQSSTTQQAPTQSQSSLQQPAVNGAMTAKEKESSNQQSSSQR
jgi:hypothetical protein